MKPKQSYSRVRWSEQFKIRLRRNASTKHEIIKTLIVLNLIEKYKRNLYWIRIYTEHQIGGSKICDIYFENIKTNEIICYEVQGRITDKWLKETKEFYENYDPIYFKADWQLIKEHDLSDDIETLDKQIEALVT